MSFREERIAHNEALGRGINEQIERAHGSPPRDRSIRIVCECGFETCDAFIEVTMDEYQRIRSDARQFCVVKEHVIHDVEEVVLEADRFTVVAKREGTAAEVATRTNTRR
ncbi:MAG TPA: hypothetical protein VJ774_04730 [Actinomycetota bacterium]|nr:hypothetical protein [Actinomycetota bacterium]